MVRLNKSIFQNYTKADSDELIENIKDYLRESEFGTSKFEIDYLRKETKGIKDYFLNIKYTIINKPNPFTELETYLNDEVPFSKVVKMFKRIEASSLKPTIEDLLNS